jgi:hypothetical protein
MDEFMNAFTAAEQTRTNREVIAYTELGIILPKIEEAVRKGDYTITVKSLSSLVRDKLEELGYKYQDNSDVREGKSWGTITWFPKPKE